MSDSYTKPPWMFYESGDFIYICEANIKSSPRQDVAKVAIYNYGQMNAKANAALIAAAPELLEAGNRVLSNSPYRGIDLQGKHYYMVDREDFLALEKAINKAEYIK